MNVINPGQLVNQEDSPTQNEQNIEKQSEEQPQIENVQQPTDNKPFVPTQPTQPTQNTFYQPHVPQQNVFQPTQQFYQPTSQNLRPPPMMQPTLQPTESKPTPFVPLHARTAPPPPVANVPLRPSHPTPSLGMQPPVVRLPEQQQKQIDPSQIPHPSSVNYPSNYKLQLYKTLTHEIPPSSTARFVTVDEGSCNPIFIRPTLHRLPQTSSLLSQSQSIMGFVVQPFAELNTNDEPNHVPIVEFETGPIRCNRCRSYINPFVKFIDNGRRFICNFCGFANEVPRWYECHLDGFGNRRDLSERPELRYGSVDFVATKDYMNKEPVPLHYVFAIDITNPDIINIVLDSLEIIVKDMAKICPTCKIGIITFGSSIQFYNLKDKHPKILFSGNVDEAFVPLPNDKLLLTVGELAADDSYFKTLRKLITPVSEFENVCGCALMCAHEILKDSGGRVILFTTKEANKGLGKIETRASLKLYGTEQERALYTPLEGSWQKFADICAKSQVCVDMFLFPSSFIESATLGHVSTTTGGQVYLYTRFDATRDRERLFFELHRNLTREVGYDTVMKIRMSTGLSLKRYFGNFYKQTNDDIDVAGMDADTAFGAEIQHDSALDKGTFNYVQCAVLYTSRSGQRLIRVHTLRLDTATTISEVFRYGDIDALVNIISRFSVTQVTKNRDPLNIVRKTITNKAIDLLASYRQHCSQSPNPGQLILPESYKLLPVYLLGLTKSPAFKVGTDVNLDSRIVAFHLLMRMPARQTIIYSYPTLYSLHDMPEQKETDYVMPPMKDLSSAHINHAGVYLLDDTVNLYFWIGKDAPQKILEPLFGVTSIDQISPNTLPKPDDSPLGNRFKAILYELRRGRSTFGEIRIFRDREQAESIFFGRFVEDKQQHTKSYMEYLCYIHKEINTKLYG